MSEKSKKTISAMLAELDEQVRWFESEDFALEEAIEKFKEAEKLAKQIEEELSTFKNKINQLKQDFSKV
ncbi:MAG TPA: exodeoxyribonuclease VII small subunit [Candidatus Saccharimonadales bacterium]